MHVACKFAVAHMFCYWFRYEDFAEVWFGESGINTEFREATGSAQKLPGRVADQYRPVLLGDEEFDIQRRQLTKRIITLTKAEVDKTAYMQDVLSTTEERAAKHRDILENGVKGEISSYKVKKSRIVKEKKPKELRAESVEPELLDNDADRKDALKNVLKAEHGEDGDDEDFADTDEVMCRWKFAFRDISKNARDQNVPTMVRTRKGMLVHCSAPNGYLLMSLFCN
jgi:hypothetical protein